MDEERWFGAKTIYHWGPSYRGRKHPLDACYEERVTLIRARDFDHAIARGKALAETYALELGDGARYLGFIDVYDIGDEIGDGAEVYSLLRSSLLAPDDFVDHYHDDGTQNSGSSGDPE
jgi:hypothetical protein